MLRQKIRLLKQSNIFKFYPVLVIVFSIAQINYAQTAPIQNPAEITTLETGKKIEREIAGGEKQIFQVVFAADQYEKIIVEQKGVDIIAKLLDTDGKSIAEYDSEWRINGAETIEFTNAAAQTYRIEISTKYKTLPAGKFEINFSEARSATEKDKSLQEARSLYNEALASRRAGKSPAAIPVAVRALEVLEKNSEGETADASMVSSLLGNLYTETSDYEKAEATYQKTLTIRTKILGESNPLVALTLGDLGVIYRLRGEPERALPLYQKSLAIREQNFGKEHPEVARMLQSIGNLSIDAGDYLEAQKYYEQALAIREKTAEPTNSAISSALNGLAVIYGELGDNLKSEQMYVRALEISEKTLPPEHPSIATYLDNLAGVYREMGDYEKAEPMYKRALAIREKSLGAEDIMVSASLNNIGNFYQDKKDFSEAEKAYLRSLEIREKKFQDKPHPWIVQSLYNLGDLNRIQFNLVKAEDYMRRALEVAEKIPGANNPSLTYALTGLASVYTEKGEYDKAEPLFRRVLKTYDETLGSSHPNKAKILTALATLYLGKNDFPAAIKAQMEANQIVEDKLSLNLALGSEQKKLDYLATLSERLNRTLTINFYAGNKKDANELALTNIIQRKGRVLDAMADTLSVLRRRFDAKDQILLDNLNETNTKLALMVLSETPREHLSEQEKQISSLEQKRDNLENEISRRAAGFFEKSKPVTLEAVRQLIPENAALVEFAIFQPYPKEAKNNDSELGESHYIAYVVGRTGEIQMKDLGKAAEIDSAIEAFRQSLHEPTRTDVTKLGSAAEEKIWKPLIEMLGDKKQILVSPDGELNLIPFEALVDAQNKYLIETYSFTYLTSGRDLLKMQTARTSKDKPLLIANPLFGAPLPETTAQLKTNARNKRSVTAARDLSETYFAPLGATSQEARSIKELFPDATLLSQAQATETALKKANAPSILHIATHGFFLEDANETLNSGDDKTKVRKAETNAKIENPLLRSGLALAGANRRSDKGDDGILTALEASGLNLWGTKLVVLSACDTGLGDVKNGEGVYGLRRALTLAGAETLVMSLWSVGDQSTRDLMTDYYKNLKQGAGRGAALREAQLAMLKRKDRQHPFYWAAFIQSGEWANLDGKR